MDTTMRAARLHEYGKPLVVERVPIPDIGDDDVLVQVKACDINGGDPHFVDLDIRLIPGAKDTTPIRTLPVTIGHHSAGIVARVGKASQHYVKEGDRVYIKGSIHCGRCYTCREGGTCSDAGNIGFTIKAHTEFGLWLMEETYRDGGAAEYVKYPAADIVKLPDEIPFDLATNMSTLALGYRVAQAGNVRPGSIVVVNAASGGSGIPALIFSRLFGASMIIAVARDRARLEEARKLVDPDLIEIITTDEDVTERIMDLTDGRGADVVMDYAPRAAESTNQCIYSLRSRGQVVLQGGNTEELSVSYRFLMSKEIQLNGCHVTGNDLPHTMDLVRRDALGVDVSSLVTHHFPLEQINDALDVRRTGKGNPVWVVIEP